MPVLAPEAPKAAALDGDVVHAALADIAKWEDGPDGTLYVYGKATTPEVDTDDQIVWAPWSGEALKEWMSEAPTVRVQHNPQRDPAGSGIKVEVNRDGDGAHWVKAAVDEPVAQRLVRKGHLRAFSVGIARPVIERDPTGKARGGIIKGGRIVEVSLVDSPANRSCWLEMAKAGKTGHAEFTGKVFGADLLTKDGRPPKAYKTVSVDLPAKMPLKGITPAVLAKMQTMAQRTALESASVTKAHVVTGPAPEVTGKRDFDPDVGGGTDRDTIPAEDFAGRNRSFPIVKPGDVSDAFSSIGRAGADNYDAATLKANILRIARRKGFPVPKKYRKGDDAAKTAVPDETKKRKVMCRGCGAKQNAKHSNCPECSRGLGDAIPVMKLKSRVVKNHEFACLHCGKDPLDKGEKFCPGCGTANPGYLPGADHQIPANKTVKERVSDQSAVKARGGKKGKKPKGGKKPKNVPPWMKDKDGDEDDAKQPKAEKRKKGGKKGRSPAAGAVPHETAPLPPHREPDGPAVEAFEHDTGIHDGDSEMKAAMAHKAAGAPPGLAALHDLTCAAFSPQATEKAVPHASFGTIDTSYWQQEALSAAAAGGADFATVQQKYNEAAERSKFAVTLATADPQTLHDLRTEHHAAFRDANADLLKTFTDATPGPGSFPAPGHLKPGMFRRPYIGAGHAAPSPQHDGPRSFAEPMGSVTAQDFTRDYISAGHAADSPANSPGHDVGMTPPSEAGRPQRTYYSNIARDNARQAITAMHDHVSRLFPDICPMSPHVGEGQKPAPGVPDAVGGPIPHAGKSAKPKAARAGKGKAKVTKSVTPKAARRAAQPANPLNPPPVIPVELLNPAPAPDLAAIVTSAVKSATAPLRKENAKQARQIRKLSKVTDAIAGQRDTTGAPYRGASAVKSAAPTMTSPAPAGPATAAQAAELAQAAHIQRLNKQWRESWNPAEREAAYAELTALLGISPVNRNDDLIPLRKHMT